MTENSKGLGRVISSLKSDRSEAKANDNLKTVAILDYNIGLLYLDALNQPRAALEHFISSYRLSESMRDFDTCSKSLTFMAEILGSETKTASGEISPASPDTAKLLKLQAYKMRELAKDINSTNQK